MNEQKTINEQANEQKRIAVSDIIEDVVCEICNEYCRFPFEIEDEDELLKKCENCPLNRLS
jgi:hypothetical protein